MVGKQNLSTHNLAAFRLSRHKGFHALGNHSVTNADGWIVVAQTLSYSKKLRVTFLCGDVHCCGIGRFYSYPKLRSFVRDHRYMPQVISSAIGNHPPPNALMALLGFSSRSKMVNHHTRTKMVKKFPGKKKLWPHRNWAEVFLRCEKEDDEDEKNKGLVFQLRCEHPDTKGKVEGAKDPMTFEEFVPRYDPTKRKCNVQLILTVSTAIKS